MLQVSYVSASLQMVNKAHIFDESSSTQVIEGVMDELEPEGITVAPLEVGDEVAKESPKSLAEEVPVDEGHAEVTPTKAESKEDASNCTWRSRKVTRCNLRLKALVRSIPLSQQ